MYQLAPLSVR